MIDKIILGCSVGIVILVVLTLLTKTCITRCIKRRRRRAEKLAASRGAPPHTSGGSHVVPISSSTPLTANVSPSGWAVTGPTDSIEMNWLASTEMLETTTKEKLRSSIQQVELSLKLAEGELNPQTKHAHLDTARNNLLRAQNTNLDLKVLHCSKARLASRSVDVLSERPGEVRIPMNDLAGGIPLIEAAAATGLAHPIPNMNNHNNVAHVHQRPMNRSVANLASYPNAHLQQNFPQPFVPPHNGNPQSQPGFRPEFFQMMPSNEGHNSFPVHLQEPPQPMTSQQYLQYMHYAQQGATPHHVVPGQSEIKKNFKIDSVRETDPRSQAGLVQREDAPQRLLSNSTNERMVEQMPLLNPVPESKNENATNATSPRVTPQQLSNINKSQSIISFSTGSVKVMDENSQLGDSALVEIPSEISSQANTTYETEKEPSHMRIGSRDTSNNSALTIKDVNEVKKPTVFLTVKENNENNLRMLRDENHANEEFSQKMSTRIDTIRYAQKERQLTLEVSDSDNTDYTEDSKSADSYEIDSEPEKTSSSGSEASEISSTTAETDDSTSPKDTSTDTWSTNSRERQQRKEQKSLTSQIKMIEEDLLVTLKRRLTSLGKEELKKPIPSDESSSSSEASFAPTSKDITNLSKESSLIPAIKRYVKKTHLRNNNKHLHNSSSTSSTDEPTKSESETVKNESLPRMHFANHFEPLLSFENNKSIDIKQGKSAESVKPSREVVNKMSFPTVPETGIIRNFSENESHFEPPHLSLSTRNQSRTSAPPTQESITQPGINQNQTPASASQSDAAYKPYGSRSEPASAAESLMNSNVVAHRKLKGTSVAFLPVPEIVRSHMREVGVDESKYCLPPSDDSELAH